MPGKCTVPSVLFHLRRRSIRAAGIELRLKKNFDPPHCVEQNRNSQQKDLNHLYRTEPALHLGDTDPRGIRFICARDDLRSIYVYERYSDTRRLIIILNATPVPRERYLVGLPSGGTWTELLNTDSAHYAGTDVGNLGAVVAYPDPAMGEPYSAALRLPPLGAVVLAATADAPPHP